MSLRGTKRGSGARGEEAGPSGVSKRRRTEPEDPALWQLRPVSDLKMSSIYNRSTSEAPAELFRKDLISAMKLPDSEPLTSSEYWVIVDTWKQDWERGVQVPVNPDSLPAPIVKIIDNPRPPDFQEFKLPTKYVHLGRDSHYLPDKHHLSATPALAEKACNYDMDATDTAWLKLLNAERARAGASAVSEDQFERVIEQLEVKTWDKIQTIMKSEEGLGIEYDENVICDVCRSPDSEDGNEMVFCDSCNICVHQACYGITVIPDGQWLCRPCGDGIKPTCVLCPNLGGAMKCTPSGHKWAHVSCVLWIPEVSIGCAENMEPITKISSIPASRWSLVCVLCRERKGACIQCSVKTCKIAYHVTCAFKHGLEMRAIIEDENAEDGVKLRSYCQKHSVNSKKEKCPGSGSEEEEVKRKRRKDMTSEEKTQARAARLQEIEREFDKHVSVEDISSHPLDVDQDAIVYIYNYWKLKRRAGHNHPLLPPKSDDNELLTHKQEQADLDKMKMFVQLRQDLERVRNLCYMVSRREKLSRSFFRIREQTFHKQVAVLSGDQSLSTPELSAIMEANHGPSIYDRLYSHPDAPDHKNDFEEMLARIAPPDSGDEKKKDRNGLAKRSKSMNPYRKHYVNGSRRSGSMYSGLSSEESGTEIGRPTRYRKTIGSSTEEDVKKPSTSPKKKVSPKGKGKKSPKKTERKKKKVPQSKAIIDSSSEDESIKSKIKKERSRSKTLQDLEKEMTDGKFGQSGTDSDDLIPIRTTRNNKFPMNIYSDTSEDSVNDCKPEKSASKIKSEKEKQDISKIEKSPTETDSQQSFPRTKAAMKEFIQQPEKKAPVKEAEKPAPKKRGRKPSNKKTTPVKSMNSDDEAKNKENVKYSKQKDATDLIVPQRQAAKKASENMRSTTIAKKEEPTSDKQASGDDAKVKPKVKPSKGKEEKESPTKPGRKKSKDAGKETIAYVPQRQAAKKAAAHIKSGLGTKAPAVETSEVDKKKDGEKSEISKLSPKKDDAKYETKPKSPAKDSSSSSSNSSSSSYSSSSSSDEEPDKPEIKPTAKAREIKPVSRQPSLFSPQSARPTVDLPFLDKVSRPLSSTSASSDSESSKGSKYSGSSSPCIKRPKRRRRKEKPVSDTSSRKAPDKKLKTSERGSDCRESSPTTEREEPSGAADTASAATRARTRSITSGGNLPHKSDSGSRKPSRDEAGPSGSSKPAKESGQSSELPTSKRKTDEEIKRQPYPLFDSPKKDLKPKSTKIKQGDAVENKAISEEPVSVNRTSPRKSVDSKPKSLAHRRMSAKDTLQKSSDLSSDDKHEPYIKQRRMSRNDNSLSSDKKSSPLKKSSTLENTSLDIPVKKSPLANQIPITDNYSDNAQPWVPKPLSPHVHPPSVEKPCDLEKYITEDKSFDSDSADKSSSKMIAKIQAKLNENTMIKSPKTPIDATTTDPMDIDNPMARNIRKRSTTESEKKYNMQDTNQIPGVEISKSAKIPINLPQPKENEVFDFDMPVEEPFNHGDHIKPFPSIPVSFFKEDSKEQGAQETLDLVDRLRLQLTKKVSVEHPIQDELGINDDKHHKNDENDSLNYIPGSREHDIMGSQDLIADYNKKPTPKDMHSSLKHLQPGIDMLHSTDAMDDKDCQPIPMTSSDKWCMPQHNSHDHDLDRKYDHMPYEEVKEPSTVQSDMQSISEVGDTISISKQSDDSQSLSVIDNSIHSNDHDTQDNQNYDNNNSVIHSDCATISSPYGNRSKWSESKITTRRSSASSTNSEGSICSRKNDMKSQMNCDSHQGSLAQDIDPYPPMPSYSSRQMESTMPLNQYTDYPPDSPFMSAMSGLNLFSVGTSQLPLPSPGPGMYSGLPYSSAPLLPPLTPLLKPAFPTLCATFTSSSQNIALTTEMIAPQTPKPIDSPRDEIDVTGSDKFFPGVSSPSIMSVDSNNESSRAPTKMSNDSNDTISSLQHESKSPSKPAKLMTKFPGKSPGKSPGISPKQSESSKGSSKRPSNRSNRSHRGRGRSKSRVQPAYLLDYMDNNSIQSKLVGTVYDFNEELANDGVDLKALREKRKSIDVRDDRKSEHSYKDTSQSPRITSPLAVISKPPSAEPKETKPSTPGSPEKSPVSKSGLSFTQVQPVLPGPVDMRTYQPLESGAAAAVAAPPVFPSHLLAFASGTADQHLPDIDVEAERQLHSDLSANVPPEPALQTPEPPPPQLPKVSLTDPRNQLKVKIKGPFLDANYGSHHQPAVAAPFAPVPTLPPPAGSTNLRRMRKKELLRQYCSTQDMGELAGPSTFVAPIPFVPPPIPRAVIAIPKAVSSMTCIPTNRDDYYKDPPLEKKKRKPASGLSRELRHLKVSMNDDVEPYEMRPSAVTVNVSHKRRGRVPKKSKSTAATPVAPKLKIKIGSNVVQHVSEEPAGFQLRPPKKRIPHVLPTPSLEYLRQESMKYRRQVMADFEEEDEVPKKVKPSKSEKRKKKKDKKAEKEKLQVINSDSESATKLIIKIKRTDDGARAGGAGPAAAAAAAAPEPVVDPFEYDPSAPDPLADPPIRLKLSRAPAGSGYVMQEPPPAPPSGVR